jgi:tripartite-type tricarboxylate transporter receptor subunit TctC
MIHRNAPVGMAEKLEVIFKQCVEDPEFIEQLKTLKMNRQWLTGAEYEELIKTEIDLYKGIIQTNKLGDRY